MKRCVDNLGLGYDTVESTRVCYDHLDNKFPSISAMCRHYGVKDTTFRARRRQGLSLKDSLSAEFNKLDRVCVDHYGNPFDTLKSMLEFYGVPYNIYT